MARPVDRAAIAREVAQFARVSDMEPDEISRRDYAEANGIDPQTAAADLDRQVRAGRMTVRQAWDRRVRRVVRVYRLVGDGRGGGGQVC